MKLTPQEIKENRAKVIKALRTGKLESEKRFKQNTTGWYNDGENKLCIFGVAMRVLPITDLTDQQEQVEELLGLVSEAKYEIKGKTEYIIDHNDNGVTFPEFADWLEALPEPEEVK